MLRYDYNLNLIHDRHTHGKTIAMFLAVNAPLFFSDSFCDYSVISRYSWGMSEGNKNLFHLERLLEFVPPNELRKCIQKTLFAYLMNKENVETDSTFSEVVESNYFLIDFLDKLEPNQTPSI